MQHAVEHTCVRAQCWLEQVKGWTVLKCNDSNIKMNWITPAHDMVHFLAFVNTTGFHE
jgi:hypothetical protein